MDPPVIYPLTQTRTVNTPPSIETPCSMAFGCLEYLSGDTSRDQFVDFRSYE
jgi:hypothetical protein